MNALDTAIDKWSRELVTSVQHRTGAHCSLSSVALPWADYDITEGGWWLEFRLDAGDALAWTYIPQRSRERLTHDLDESEFSAALSEALSRLGDRRTSFTLPSPTPSAPSKSLELCGYSMDINLPAGTCTLGVVLNAAAVALVEPPSEAYEGAGMDLLLDMELPVTICIGSTKLPLKDVLKLTTGSIVELDRLITEPVEVRVSNRVIAKAEVVVIDGNYGVRILEIVSRSERMALRAGARRGTQSAVSAHAGSRTKPMQMETYS